VNRCAVLLKRIQLTSECLNLLLCFPQDQEGKPKRVDIHDNKDGTYTVTYVPDKTGRYTIGVKYGGDDIPSSPYRIRASPAGDASKCLATGVCWVLAIAVVVTVGVIVDVTGCTCSLCTI